jgi:hypothetical protein
MYPGAIMKALGRIGAAVLTAAVVALVSFGANASPITYDFTVTGTTGPLSGITATGSFAYDSSIVPAGGGSVSGTNLLTTLNFTWDGIIYNQTTANTGSLGFDPSGALFNAEFGTNCTAGGCSTTSGFEQWEVSQTVLGSVGGFEYGIAGHEGLFVGNARLTKVPEPLTLSIFGAGLAGAVAIRRRKKAKAA